MASNPFVRRFVAAVAAFPLLAVLSACNIKTEDIPSVVGPSEFGLSLALSATPDTVSRDGRSMSVVTVTARDAEGRPAAGQRVALSLSPGNGGTISATDVVTGPDGRATFEFTAPPSSSAVDFVSILATPVGQNFDNAVPRSMSIRLLGPAAAVPSFTVVPAAPERMQAVTFDASGTTFNGAVCGDSCTYVWAFGNEQNLAGRVVTYRFQNAATYSVQLTVNSPAGTIATTTQNVVVTAGTVVASISFSPTNPRVGDKVFFNGTGSTSTGAATIVDYQWDFGHGSTGSGATTDATYAASRIYTVRLTVRDSFGRTATATTTVNVAP